MVQIDGEQLEKTIEALCEVYDRDTLTQILKFRLNRTLEHVAGKSPLPDTFFSLLTKAEQEGWLLDCLKALSRERPHSQYLAQIVREIEKEEHQKFGNERNSSHVPSFESGSSASADAGKFADAIGQGRDPNVPDECGPSGTPLQQHGSVAAFVGIDPAEGLAALERLAILGPDVLTTLLQHSSSLDQTRLLLRKLCTRLGAPATPILLDAIRVGSWHTKLSAAPCFAAFRGDATAQDGLYRLLKEPDFDVQRLAIEAIGHAGDSYVRWDIVRLAKTNSLQHDSDDDRVNRYSFDKLRSYVIEALMRCFSQQGGTDQLDHLENFVNLCIKHGHESYIDWSITAAMEDLTPAAADALASRWLHHRDKRFRKFALEAFTSLRIQRMAKSVTSILVDRAEDSDIRSLAGICLGAFGSANAARYLAVAVSNWDHAPGFLWAFSNLYAHRIDWPECSHVIESALFSSTEVRQQMLVSLGLRSRADFREAIEGGLLSTDPFVRGTSALALSHLLGLSSLPMLEDAAEEAAEEIERVFSISALIHGGRPGCGDALHEALQKLTLKARLRTLRPFWLREILSAMTRADGQTSRAQIWAEVAGADLPRVLAEANALSGGAATS